MTSSGSAADTDPPGDAEAVDDADLLAARRTVGVLAAAVLAGVLGLVVFLVDSRLDDQPAVESADGSDGSSQAPAADRIGPEEGVDIPGYLADRADALAAADGRVVAVVSLTGYSTLETTESLVEGLDVDSFLIALPGGEPARTRDVGDHVEAMVAEARARLDEVEEIAPTVEDDPAYEEFYAAEIERFRGLIESAERGDIVFGAVVEGSAADLRALASRASVRAVDARTGVEIVGTTDVAGIRPEERTEAGTPRFRP